MSKQSEAKKPEPVQEEPVKEEPVKEEPTSDPKGSIDEKLDVIARGITGITDLLKVFTPGSKAEGEPEKVETLPPATELKVEDESPEPQGPVKYKRFGMIKSTRKAE